MSPRTDCPGDRPQSSSRQRLADQLGIGEETSADIFQEEQLRSQLRNVCKPVRVNLVQFTLPLHFDDGREVNLTLSSDTWVRFAQWQGLLLSHHNGIARAYFVAHGRFPFGRHRHPYREKITIVEGSLMEREPHGDGVMILSDRDAIENDCAILHEGDVLLVEPDCYHDPVMLDVYNGILLEWSL